MFTKLSSCVGAGSHLSMYDFESHSMINVMWDEETATKDVCMQKTFNFSSSVAKVFLNSFAMLQSCSFDHPVFVYWLPHE